MALLYGRARRLISKNGGFRLEQDHRNELELVMDTMESLHEAEDGYQQYRELMALCVALTCIACVTFLDSVMGVRRFV
jgi:hypothetical protein